MLKFFKPTYAAEIAITGANILLQTGLNVLMNKTAQPNKNEPRKEHTDKRRNRR